jgi:hypothetical protein
MKYPGIRKPRVGVFPSNLAEICESKKTDNMAEVERQGGIWTDGYLSDDRHGSLSRDESYRDSKGVLAHTPSS